jgi:hypothetical protein
MMLETQTDNVPLKKQELKTKAIQLNDRLVQTSNLTNNSSVIMGDSMFSTYMYRNNESKGTAVSYSHPIYNSTDCENLLVKVYNLTSVDDIVFVTNIINATLIDDDSDSNSYKFSAYAGGQKLDIDVCDNLTYSIQIPIDNKFSVNLTKYKELKAQGIDTLDPNDPAFTDRCYSHVDNTTGGDTTLNWRQQHYYQQKIPMCIGVNCTYKGISQFDYVECACTGLQTNNMVAIELMNKFLVSASKLNIGIVRCYNRIISVNLILT